MVLTLHRWHRCCVSISSDMKDNVTSEIQGVRDRLVPSDVSGARIFDERALTYEFFDIDRDQRAHGFVLAAAKGQRRFPLVVVEDDVMTVPTIPQLQCALDAHEIGSEREPCGARESSDLAVVDGLLWSLVNTDQQRPQKARVIGGHIKRPPRRQQDGGGCDLVAAAPLSRLTTPTTAFRMTRMSKPASRALARQASTWGFSATAAAIASARLLREPVHAVIRSCSSSTIGGRASITIRSSRTVA